MNYFCVNLRKVCVNLRSRLRRDRGFTLIETLTALLIFSTSIVVLIAATSGGFSNTNYAKNKLIASYLAQEGVEIVRNARDSFGWDNFESNSQVTNLLGLQQLTRDFSNFERKITIGDDQGGKKIISIVSWNQGLKDVTYVEYLFDWQ